MPFVRDRPDVFNLPVPLPESEPDLPAPTFGATIAAALPIDNTVFSAISRVNGGAPFKPDPAYNPYEHDDLTGYPPSSFIFSRSRDETQQIRDRVDREREHRAVLERAPWYMELPARLMAGILDPIVWIPIGGQALRGGKAAKSALKFAGAAAAGEVLTEIPLQATQAERTAVESALNVSGAGVLGGVIGGVVGKWASRQLPYDAKPYREVAEALEDDLSRVDVLLLPAPPERLLLPAPTPEQLAETIGRGLPEERGVFFPLATGQGAVLDVGGRRRAGLPVEGRETLFRTRAGIGPIREPGDRRTVDELGLFVEKRIGVERRITPSKRVREERRLAPGFLKLPELRERLKDELFRLEIETPELRRSVLEQATGKGVIRSQADFAQAVDILRNTEFVDTAAGRTVLVGRRDGERVILSAETVERRVTPRRREAPERREGERRVEPLRRGVDRRRVTDRRAADLGRAGRVADEERDRTVEFWLSDPFDDVPPSPDVDIVLRDTDVQALPAPTPEAFSDPVPTLRRSYGDHVDETPPGLESAAKLGPEGETLTAATEATAALNKTRGDIVREGLPDITADQASRLTLAKDRWFRVVSRLFPNLRGETSPFRTMVAATERLVEQVLPRLKNLEGKASEFAVESGQKRMRGKFIQVRRIIKEQYEQYRTARGRGNYHEFKAQIAAAMRRGDSHADAIVTNAARAIRPFYAEVFGFAQRMGVPGVRETDPGLVRFAESYLNRSIDRHTVETGVRNAQGETFREMLRRVLVDPDIARDIEFKVQGLSVGRPFEDALIEVAAARQRTLSVPDIELEPWLVNDIEQLAELYFRSVGTDAYLLRAGAGTIEGDGFKRAITQEADGLIQTAATEAERVKLRRRLKRDLDDLDVLIARLRHTHLGPDSPVQRTVNGYRKVSVILRLPNIALASVPDMARTIMTEGFVRAVGSGWLPMLRNFRAAKLAHRHLAAMGTALDQEINHTLQQLTLTGRVGEATFLDRGVDAFSRFTGMRWWNSTQKAIAGAAVQSEILHIAGRTVAGRASQKQIAKLGRLGLNANAARRIMQQFDEFGERVDGSLIPNVNRWTDADAAELYTGAIVKEVDAIIVTPGIGDVPAMFDDSIVRAFFQFRSFGLASVQRTVALGFADGKLGNKIQVLEGAIGLVALGGLVDEIRRRINGDDRDLGVWTRAVRAVDRSGVTGIFSDWTRSVDTMSGGFFTDMVDQETIKRRGGSPGRQFAQNIFGLPYRDVRNAVDAVHGIGTLATGGQITRGQLRAAGSFVPLSNWWALRVALNQVDAGEAIEREFGIPPEPPR